MKTAPSGPDLHAFKRCKEWKPSRAIPSCPDPFQLGRNRIRPLVRWAKEEELFHSGGIHTRVLFNSNRSVWKDRRQNAGSVLIERIFNQFLYYLRGRNPCLCGKLFEKGSMNLKFGRHCISNADNSLPLFNTCRNKIDQFIKWACRLQGVWPSVADCYKTMLISNHSTNVQLHESGGKSSAALLVAKKLQLHPPLPVIHNPLKYCITAWWMVWQA